MRPCTYTVIKIQHKHTHIFSTSVYVLECPCLLGYCNMNAEMLSSVLYIVHSVAGAAQRGGCFCFGFKNGVEKINFPF